MHKLAAAGIFLFFFISSAAEAGAVLICTSQPKPVAAVKGRPAQMGPAWTRKIYTEVTGKDLLTCSNGQKEKLTELLMSGDYRLVSLGWRATSPKKMGSAIFDWYGVVVLAAE